MRPNKTPIPRTREEARQERYELGLASLPVEVRRVILEVVSPYAAREVCLAAGRAEQKRESNRWRERERRALVGVRLPLTTVDRMKACAEREGVTMYRWTKNALMEACRRSELGYNI